MLGVGEKNEPQAEKDREGDSHGAVGLYSGVRGYQADGDGGQRGGDGGAEEDRKPLLGSYDQEGDDYSGKRGVGHHVPHQALAAEHRVGSHDAAHHSQGRGAQKYGPRSVVGKKRCGEFEHQTAFREVSLPGKKGVLPPYAFTRFSELNTSSTRPEAMSPTFTMATRS